MESGDDFSEYNYKYLQTHCDAVLSSMEFGDMIAEEETE